MVFVMSPMINMVKSPISSLVDHGWSTSFDRLYRYRIRIIIRLWMVISFVLRNCKFHDLIIIIIIVIVIITMICSIVIIVITSVTMIIIDIICIYISIKYPWTYYIIIFDGYIIEIYYCYQVSNWNNSSKLDPVGVSAGLEGESTWPPEKVTTCMYILYIYISKMDNDGIKHCVYIYMVGGLQPWNFIFPLILGDCHHPSWLILFRGVETTNLI